MFYSIGYKSLSVDCMNACCFFFEYVSNQLLASVLLQQLDTAWWKSNVLHAKIVVGLFCQPPSCIPLNICVLGICSVNTDALKLNC